MVFMKKRAFFYITAIALFFLVFALGAQAATCVLSKDPIVLEYKTLTTITCTLDGMIPCSITTAVVSGPPGYVNSSFSPGTDRLTLKSTALFELGQAILDVTADDGSGNNLYSCSAPIKSVPRTFILGDLYEVILKTDKDVYVKGSDMDIVADYNIHAPIFTPDPAVTPDINFTYSFKRLDGTVIDSNELIIEPNNLQNTPQGTIFTFGGPTPFTYYFWTTQGASFFIPWPDDGIDISIEEAGTYIVEGYVVPYSDVDINEVFVGNNRVQKYITIIEPQQEVSVPETSPLLVLLVGLIVVLVMQNSKTRSKFTNSR